MNALDERAVRALESIAESLVRLANPLLVARGETANPDQLRPGAITYVDGMGQPSTFQGGFNAQVE